MKKSEGQSKKVSAKISIVAPEGIQHRGMNFDSNGDIYYVGIDGQRIDASQVTREVFHERPKSPKVRSRLSIDTGRGVTGESTWLGNFDDVYVIDTNTQHIDGTQVSASVFVRMEFRDTGDTIEVFSPETHPNVYLFRGEQKKPELQAIRKLVIDLINSQSFSSMRKVAIVTDTELGKHDSMNAGRLPILGNFFLPHRFSLHYASADTGWEFLNGVIKKCDKQAAATLNDYVSAKPLDEQFKSLPYAPGLEFLFGHRNATISFTRNKVPKNQFNWLGEMKLYGVREDGTRELLRIVPGND